MLMFDLIQAGRRLELIRKTSMLPKFNRSMSAGISILARTLGLGLGTDIAPVWQRVA
jgi:hypothetical protein